jgi:hypothetical protein
MTSCYSDRRPKAEGWSRPVFVLVDLFRKHGCLRPFCQRDPHMLPPVFTHFLGLRWPDIINIPFIPVPAMLKRSRPVDGHLQKQQTTGQLMLA